MLEWYCHRYHQFGSSQLLKTGLCADCLSDSATATLQESGHFNAINYGDLAAEITLLIELQTAPLALPKKLSISWPVADLTLRYHLEDMRLLGR